MKKLIVVITFLFIGITYLNAEEINCSYSKKKELNTLSMYVEASYEYKGNNLFDLKISNLTEELNIESDKGSINGNIISSLEEGTKIKLTVLATNNACAGETLRIINVTIPYVNPYYGSNKCIGNENLNVCSNEFLEYKLSETTFNNLIQKANEDNTKVEEPTTDGVQKENKTFFEKVYDAIKRIYIPVGLVVGSSLLTLLIFRPIYRKIKHGL